MGSFANTLFTIMLGWLQTAAYTIWNAFTNENGNSVLQWIGGHWIILAAILCVAGLLADLGVYLVRWRPMLVWRSFFHRLRHRESDPSEPEQAVPEPAAPGNLFRREERGNLPGREEETQRIPARQAAAADVGQYDFSRWETEKREPEPAPKPVRQASTITGAGYTVPEDSPYRRPVDPADDEMAAEPYADEYETERPEIMTQRKKRRRLIVGELFSDPEEELYQYEMPQQLIDKNKASHQPVYPRNWKRDEGDGE